MRLDFRNAGTAIALALFVLVVIAAACFLAVAPRTPDVFTGHVYPLRVLSLTPVYLTDVEHDLLGIGFFAALAALFVGVGLRGVISHRPR